ncbi:paraquat-inducible protein A [Erwinia psidii]|uniref:Paraquat-inducible protein A n=1 Tax=Erwinia psidii TaxID=69224 RepID=A0A3N6RUM9_9GAMM|nr:paraquat-inducible protein A [Erwinia psidii]MCX8959252.1 hypothetical protein [Erwinia psidii]MCX8962882.1 hypothetical protein [Erwinia psidii]MCX8966029.1 hypothetical protein [Erwinia psidii]RQM36678.1 hypothetical protein EB241_19070 [Erwinia psidii]
MNTVTDSAHCSCCNSVHRCPTEASGSQPACCHSAAARVRPESYHSRQLALILSAAFALPIASFLPLITVGFQGNARQVTLENMVVSLVQSHQWLLAIIVALIFILFPMAQLFLFGWLSTFASLSRRAPGQQAILRLLQWLNPWCMSDICLLGLLVAGYKMAEFIQLNTGPGFWALIWVALMSRSMTQQDLAASWHSSVPPSTSKTPPEGSGKKMMGCHRCGLLCQPDLKAKFASRCPRCHTLLARNPANTLSCSTALLLAALFCYLPANLLPVMQTTFLGGSSEKTIFSGVAAFWNSGASAIATIIFIASVMIPVLKFLVMGVLIITCYLQSQWAVSRRAQLYRLTEAIGYLSLLDVIVVVIMSCALQFAPSITVEPRSGIIFFALSVILTMLSALSFDPGLIGSRRHHE